MSDVRAPETSWQASQRVWRTYCRHELANMFEWLFPSGSEPIETLEADEFDWVVGYELRQRISSVAPVWEQLFREPLPPDARAQVAEAFAFLRTCARQIATGEGTPHRAMTVVPFLTRPPGDTRDGRARWQLRGRLADQLVWMGLTLLSEVERSLIRACTFKDCPRVFVATRNQRRCYPHQAEGRRETQRRAIRAFRERARAAKKTKRTTSKKRKRR